MSFLSFTNKKFVGSKQLLLREKSGHKTHKKQYFSCHFKQQMTSITLLFRTANSSKADTTRVFEEET